MWRVISDAFWNWQADNASRLAAALAFYTLFSIAPMFMIVTAISAGVAGEAAAQGELVGYLDQYLGPTGARVVVQAAEQANREFSGPLAMALGFVALLFGATAVFANLQGSLNTVWGVEGRPGFRGLLYQRLFAFLMVVAIGFLLLASVAVTAVLAWVGGTFQETFPRAAGLWQAVNLAVSFSTTTVLFALVFRFVPEATIRWRDVWAGAAMTALLFTAGQSVLGMYVGGGAIASVYGAAGSLVVLLLWIYYSAQVFLFGAELTQAYAARYGRGIRSRLTS